MLKHSPSYRTSPDDRACITGRGVFASGGTTIENFWDSCITGRRTTTVTQSLSGLKVNIANTVDSEALLAAVGPLTARRADRFVQLGVAAAYAAIEDSGVLHATAPERIGVVMGNSLGGAKTLSKLQHSLDVDGEALVSPLALPASINNMLAGCISLKIGAHGPSLVISTACASGTDAIGIARHVVESGAADVVIAGGSEAPITPTIVAAFTRMGAISTATSSPEDACRPFSRARSGFTIGEGGGVVVVERLSHARGRGREPYAAITGYASTNDATHETSPAADGRWYELAIRRALSESGITPDGLHYWNMHGTGTRINDRVESTVASSVVGLAVPVGSTKPLTGHCLGATGAIEAVVCSLAITEGIIPPSLNSDPADSDLPDLDLVQAARDVAVSRTLTTSLGFGGHNSALVLEAA